MTVLISPIPMEALKIQELAFYQFIGDLFISVSVNPGTKVIEFIDRTIVDSSGTWVKDYAADPWILSVIVRGANYALASAIIQPEQVEHLTDSLRTLGRNEVRTQGGLYSEEL